MSGRFLEHVVSLKDILGDNPPTMDTNGTSSRYSASIIIESVYTARITLMNQLKDALSEQVQHIFYLF